MKKLLFYLYYPFSVVFYLFFGLALVIFHPLQWIALNAFGYQAHKSVVDALQWVLMRCLNILGTRYTFDKHVSLPSNVPVIIASNHQSMWDIPPIIWYMRSYHPKFISKIELGKGIPSISYNLRHGGAALIDRKNPVQAKNAIVKIGKYAQQHNRSVVIFPEGTRSRTGAPKPWKRRGLETLFEHMPDGYIIPVSVSNSWRLQRYGMFPMPLGTHLKFIAHPAIKISDHTPLDLINMVEQQVNTGVQNT